MYGRGGICIVARGETPPVDDEDIEEPPPIDTASDISELEEIQDGVYLSEKSSLHAYDVSPKPSRDKGDFGEKGRFDDEVTLRFDDADEFYVSTGFLKMASPVFMRMLEADFKEKATRAVELKGKDPDDFLELLWFLHPAVQKRITESTVFRILPLAEEYEVKSAISDCKAIMKKLLDGAVLPNPSPVCDHNQGPKEARRGTGIHNPPASAFGAPSQPAVFGGGFTPNVQSVQNAQPLFWTSSKQIQELKNENRTVITTNRRHVKSLHDCLKVFEAAVQFVYDDIEDAALRVISKYPALLYTKSSTPKEHAGIDCVKLYARLHDREKIKILSGRLEVRDDVCKHRF